MQERPDLSLEELQKTSGPASSYDTGGLRATTRDEMLLLEPGRHVTLPRPRNSLLLVYQLRAR